MFCRRRLLDHLGGVRIGSNISVTDGTISVAAPYVLPAATSGALGGIKIGDNISVTVDGTISVSTPYALPIASDVTRGGVKIGDNVSINTDGAISVAAPYVLPQASPTQTGGIKIGNNLSVDGSGFLNASFNTPTATTSTVGGILGVVNSTVHLGTRGIQWTTPGTGAVGIGNTAGNSNQGNGAVAVGAFAGAENQGANSIAIGNAAGQINQPLSTVVLNATGSALNPATASATYIAPVRTATTNNVMYYNTSTKEVSQGPMVVTSYTTANLNRVAVTTATGTLAYVTDAPGGANLCFFDGSSWKTVTGFTI
jgi:hypothetical protein